MYQATHSEALLAEARQAGMLIWGRAEDEGSGAAAR